MRYLLKISSRVPPCFSLKYRAEIYGDVLLIFALDSDVVIGIEVNIGISVVSGDQPGMACLRSSSRLVRWLNPKVWNLNGVPQSFRRVQYMSGSWLAYVP